MKGSIRPLCIAFLTCLLSTPVLMAGPHKAANSADAVTTPRRVVTAKGALMQDAAADVARPHAMRVAPSSPDGSINDTVTPAGVDTIKSGMPIGAPRGVDPIRNVDTGETFASIQAAIADADTDTGHIIEVQTLAHSEGIVTINKAVTIRGQSPGTVISATTNTGTTGDARGWFLGTVSDLTIRDLTLDGSGRSIYQAIRLVAGGTVENCHFQNIAGSPPNGYDGRAIAVTGPSAIRDCTMTNIRRIGVHIFGSTAGTVVERLVYTGKGNGDFLDYGIELGGGATATLTANTITDCRGVAASDNSTSAAILITDYYAPGTAGVLQNNVLTNNTGGIAVGYLATDESDLSAHNNDLSGNVSYGIGHSGSSTNTLDASGNWWGSSVQADVAAEAIGSPIDYTPWLDTGTDSSPAAGFQGSFTSLWVDDDGVQSGGVGRIQEAINLVSGSTVHVMPGTYNENLVITTDDLQLIGPNAGLDPRAVPCGGGMPRANAEAILDGGMTGETVAIHSDGVVIDGFTIQGGLSGVWTANAAEGFEIINNVITNNAIGVSPACEGPSEVRSNLIDGNNQPGPAGGAGIYEDRGNQNLTIADNEIVNHLNNSAIVLAATAANTHKNIAINGNHIHDNNSANSMVYVVSMSNGSITNNRIHQAGTRALKFAGANVNVSVSGNDFSGSGEGVRVEDDGYGFGANSGIAITGNLFASMGTIAVANVSGHTGTLNASANWWDSNTAAGVSSAIDNSGGAVDYTPWLDTGTNSAGACDGFTGDLSVLWVDDVPQTGSTGRIQEAVNLVTGSTVNVLGGMYEEDVLINKSISLLGEGADTTSVFGAIGGDPATIRIQASSVTLAGFSISRLGNTFATWNNPNLNSAGIAIQGQALTGALIRDNNLFGNRTGIDINNSNGHTIRNNKIDDNRTGLLFRNQTDNIVCVENSVANNWTVGILFLDASGGTNSPIQTAANCTFRNNNISGNWYGQIVDRQVGGAVLTPGTNLKNFSGNWYGSPTPVVSSANSAEPGYGALIPVIYGGSDAPPGGQPDILGPASANFDMTPYLDSGVDTDVEATPGNGTNGFQGDFSTLHVTSELAQTQAIGRIQEGVNSVTASTVLVGPGTFEEVVNINAPNVKVIGSGEANTIIDYTGKVQPGGFNGGVYSDQDGVELRELTVTRSVAAGALPASPRYGIKFDFASNMVIDGVTVSNSYRTGLDLHGVEEITVNNVTSVSNGGAGIFMTDVKGADLSNITTGNNPWTGVSVSTSGQFVPLGTSDVVFSGTNSFGESAGFNGGLQLEMFDFFGHTDYDITWSSHAADGANVTIQSSDFGYALSSATFGPAFTKYVRFYGDLAQAQAAAAAVSPGPDHIIAGGRYIQVADDSNDLANSGPTSLHVYDFPGDTMNIQAAINAASTSDVDTVHIGSGSYVGPVDTSAAAVILSPGESPGQVVIAGDLLLSPGNSLAIEVNGTTPGTGFDQFVVNGAVNLGGATLDVSGTIVLPVGPTQIRIIDNDGADPVIGTFAGLPNGAGVEINGQSFAIFYDRGTGNDVVLIRSSGSINLEPVGGDTCIEAAQDQVTVELWMRDVTENASGWQAFVTYDATRFALNGPASSYNNTFFTGHTRCFVLSMFCSSSVVFSPGMLSLDGYGPFGPTSVSGDHLLATLVFDVLPAGWADCETSEIELSDNPPAFFTELSFGGSPVTAERGPAAVFSYDASAPGVSCSIAEASPVVVDGSCSAAISYSATITDPCGVNAAAVDASLSVLNGTVLETSETIINTDANTVTVSGTAIVSDLTACTALGVPNVTLTVNATDACGNAAPACTAELEVRDDSPPAVVINVTPTVITAGCSVDVPFTATISDNCCLDAGTVDAADFVAIGDGVLIDGVTLTDVSGTNPISVEGYISVKDITSPCPASVSLTGFAEDCCGNTFTSAPVSASVTDVTLPDVTYAELPLVMDVPTLTLPADAGGCDALVAMNAVASDNCAGALPVSYFADIDNNGSYETLLSNPATLSGTVKIEAQATDTCGNTGVFSFTVVVNAVNTVQVTVRLEGVFDPTTRCISFVPLLAGGPCVENTIVNELAFTHPDGDPLLPVEYSGPVSIPCGNYDSMCAKDEQHTLSDSQPISISSTIYVAGGDYVLLGGDTDNDDDVDINDVTLFLAQFGTAAEDGGCPWDGVTRDSDFSNSLGRNGEDYTFLSNNWLEFRNCCGSFGSYPLIAPDTNPGDQPVFAEIQAPGSLRGSKRLAISVIELPTALQAADLTGDGVVDELDVEAFEAIHGLSNTLSSRIRADKVRLADDSAATLVP